MHACMLSFLCVCCVQRQAAEPDRSVLALSIALQHPDLSTDPRIMCAAARACKAWRAAVQQCSACNTAITINPEASLPQLCSLARWLAKHAPLVTCITAVCGFQTPLRTVHGLLWGQHVATAQQLLEHALQLAAIRAAAAAAAATPPPTSAAAPPTQQQQGLRLRRFTSNCLVTTDTLAALPGHSLTRLELNLMHSSSMDGSLLSAALANLSRLQHLSLSSTSKQRPVAGSCLLGLMQLGQLTSLELKGVWSADTAAPLQQLLSQPLPLQQLHLDLWRTSSMQRPPALDLAALVQLRGLSIINDLPDGSVLPLQLQQLHLGDGAISADGWSMLLPLQQLQQLTLVVMLEEQEPMLGLTELRALQHLVLRYSRDTDVGATAAAWRQLPQLQELSIGHMLYSPSKEEMESVVSGIAAASSLTQLHLQVYEVTWFDGAAAAELISMAACAQIACLSRLKDLTLTCEHHEHKWLEAGDALALTALTGLTSLCLRGLDAAVGDLEATALACNVPQLRDLDLSDTSLDSMVCLAAIAKLTQLTKLSLRDPYERTTLSQRGLMLLTSLSRLQELDVGEVEAGGVTAQGLGQIWAAVRGQQRQQRVG